MILLFVVFAWIALLSIVVGLCMAAQMGDRAQLVSAGELRGQHLQITARPGLRPAEPRGSRLDRNGVAA
ncbi:MAG: hypothetical protein JWN10_1878 [Solirubrobacterales bacterium]|nr:hypothetical protein [Solirubrobacterales bacterium]